MVDKLTPQEYEILSESPADTTAGMDADTKPAEDAPEGVVEQQED
jgi:hypothetical protein